MINDFAAKAVNLLDVIINDGHLGRYVRSSRAVIPGGSSTRWHSRTSTLFAAARLLLWPR